MQLDDLLANGRHPFTYCTNVHPAPDLAAAERIYREHAAPVLHAALGEGVAYLGAWWPGDVAATLARDGNARARHVTLCRELALVPASLNVFPAGRFHDERVKEAVYVPDWSDPARLAYTLDAARAAAAVLQALGHPRCVMSTVPLGFRGHDRAARPIEEHAANLFRLALALEELESETGVHVLLALEPEPWCLLESIEETVRWLCDDALAFAARAGNEAAARRHLGICIDLCHAAVIGESALEGVRLCIASGVRIGKVQLSAAPVARGPEGLRALLAYDEPVYLHQTFARGGAFGPFLDLADSALPTLALGDDDVLVSHFHVPLHWDGEGVLAATKSEVCAFLDAVKDGALPEGTPLEVETYTNPNIADEVAFATGYLLR